MCLEIARGEVEGNGASSGNVLHVGNLRKYEICGAKKMLVSTGPLRLGWWGEGGRGILDAARNGRGRVQRGVDAGGKLEAEGGSEGAEVKAAWEIPIVEVLRGAEKKKCRWGSWWGGGH